MNWTKNLTDLNVEISDLYPTRIDATRLASQANIRTSFIRWQDQSLNDWFNVMEEADKQNRLINLLQVIKNERRVGPLIDIVLSELGNEISGSSEQISQPTAHQQPSSLNDNITFFIPKIKDLIDNDSLDDAARLLRDFVKRIDNDLENTAIGFSSRLKMLRREKENDTISDSNYKINRNQIRHGMLGFIDSLPEEIRIKNMIDGFGSEGTSSSPDLKSFSVSLEENFEKLIGNKNERVPMQWAMKATLAGKCICRILIGGRAKGTGFLLKNGYVMTNNHVLYDTVVVNKAEIEFNYEEGKTTDTIRYKLDPNDFKTNSKYELDYSYIRVIDNSEQPLSQWGYLELETKVDIEIGDPVNIIQHPLGKVKEMAFRSNEITHIWGNKVFYRADTDEGSSGSPVCNDDWKVVALHSKGPDEDNGEMVINDNGEKASANRGISIKAIATHLGLD